MPLVNLVVCSDQPVVRRGRERFARAPRPHQTTSWPLNTIIPATNPTNSSHPERSSPRCIAQHFMHRSHAWYRQQKNAGKSANPERLQIPSGFYSKNNRFGDFLASEWFECTRSDFGTWLPDLRNEDRLVRESVKFR